MKSTKLRIAVGLAATAALAVAAIAWATPGSISSGPYQIPVTAEFQMSPKVCDNTGSTVDVSGTLSFPGIGVEIRFQNQDNNTTKGNGWHHGEVETTAALSIYDIDPNVIPKQPVRGGVGGNPWIYIQLLDDDGNTITEPLLVGRCVMGNSYRSGKYTGYVDASATALLQAIGCDQKGAYVTIGGDASHEGVDALVIFTNNRKFTHMTTSDASVTLNLTDSFSAHKGDTLNGGKVTGNPLLSAHFVGSDGNALQDFIPLGRCNQLN